TSSAATSPSYSRSTAATSARRRGPPAPTARTSIASWRRAGCAELPALAERRAPRPVKQRRVEDRRAGCSRAGRIAERQLGPRDVQREREVSASEAIGGEGVLPPIGSGLRITGQLGERGGGGRGHLRERAGLGERLERAAIAEREEQQRAR